MQAPNSAPGKRRRARVALNRPAARRATLLAAVVVCLEHMRPSSAASTSPSPPITSRTSHQADGPFGADAIANFLQKRCGSPDIDERPALWSYEGSLTDPTTGRVVAEVEGLELVKPLPTLEASNLSNDDGPSILGGLFAKDMLCSKPTKAAGAPQWDAATTVLSRRLFCYRRPQSRPNEDKTSNSNENPYNSLLASLRLRPDGPLRHLSPLENMAVYDSAITYVSRNGGREMAVFSERGGRADGALNENGSIGGGRSKQYVIGSAQTESSSDGQSSSELDFTILAQRGTRGRSDEPKLPPLKLVSSNRDGSEEVVISPPRSRLLQFGKGDGGGGASERKYGSVRETYRYTFDDDGAVRGERGKLLGFYGHIMQKLGRKQRGEELPQSPKCAVRYTRYGEAPPWYAPGRSCTLELRGKRIALTRNANDGGSTYSNLTDRLPPLASWAASKCDFWSGWPRAFSSISRRSENDDFTRQQSSHEARMQQAVDSFCNERQPSFGHLEDCPVAERKKWLVSTEMALSKLLHTCARRISKSFVVSEPR